MRGIFDKCMCVLEFQGSEKIILLLIYPVTGQVVALVVFIG